MHLLSFLLVLTYRSRVLRIWKEKQKYNATYINLLKCVVAGKDHKTAKKICGLEVFQGRPLQQGGGTRVYQQPAGILRLLHACCNCWHLEPLAIISSLIGTSLIGEFLC